MDSLALVGTYREKSNRKPNATATTRTLEVEWSGQHGSQWTETGMQVSRTLNQDVKLGRLWGDWAWKQGVMI